MRHGTARVVGLFAWLLATAGGTRAQGPPAGAPGAPAAPPPVVTEALAPAPAPVMPPPRVESPSGAPTRVAIFLPFHVAGLRDGVAVSERASGRCFAGSLSSGGRPDAWRCNSGDRIYDPCFEGTQDERTVLLCVDTPWAEQRLLLTPNQPLPRGEANPANLTGSLPWALELANGARCELLSGATSVSAGLRVNYWCDGETSVIGDIDRQQPQWQVFFVPAEGTAAERIGVTAAWY